ncbi:hypothetical protein KCU64_g5176, partial [Aureobasidium melanogenum]
MRWWLAPMKKWWTCVRRRCTVASREDLRIQDEKTTANLTYGHSQLKTGHPVRSAIHKQLNGRLVLR